MLSNWTGLYFWELLVCGLFVTATETPLCFFEGLQRLVHFHMSQNPTCNSFTFILDYSVEGSAILNYQISLPYVPTHTPSLQHTHIHPPLPHFQFSILKNFGCRWVSIEIRSKSVHGQFPPHAWEARQLECPQQHAQTWSQSNAKQDWKAECVEI